MLTEIISALREAEGPMDLNELSRRLGTERSALEGMLKTLVRQGRLKEVTIGSEECGHCRGRSGCQLLRSGNLMGKVYELTEKSR